MADNRMYQLYELRDEYEDALNNCKEVIKNQLLLVDVLSASGKSEFNEIITGTQENIKDEHQSVEKATSRIAFLDELISMYEAQDEKSELVAHVVTLVLEAIGATAPEKSN